MHINFIVSSPGDFVGSVAACSNGGFEIVEYRLRESTSSQKKLETSLRR